MKLENITLDIVNLTEKIQKDKHEFINHLHKIETEKYKKLSIWKKLFYQWKSYQDYVNVWLNFKLAEIEIQLNKK